MAKMQSLKPARKVSVAALVGAATSLVLWIIESAAGVKVPSYIATSIMTILSFIVAWLVPPSADDQVVTS
jgi:hypothetical protein